VGKVLAMDSFLNRYKNILVLVSVLVAQIIGLAAQIRRPNPGGPDGSSVRLIRSWAVGLISPPEKALRGMGRGVRGLWSNYLDLRHVRQQNQDLRAQLGRLQLEQAALLEDARQGQRLQQLLAFREHYIHATVPAQVIGTSGTDQSRVLYIDKGVKDGLKPDMAVITPDGIVGKLKDVFSDTAQVLEISDQTSGAGVLLESTRLRGVLRGNALGQPQVINLLPDDRIKPGEHVITSGGDQIYPRGLPVGEVDHVVPDPQNPPFIDVVIKPAANLGRLEEVLIITKTGADIPQKAKEDMAQSAAVASTQRAADILAERLPGIDPPKPSVAGQAAVAADDIPAAVKAPPARHTDRFSPDATPPAADLTPGKPFAAPLPRALPPAVFPRSAAATAPKGNGETATKPVKPPTASGVTSPGVTASGTALRPKTSAQSPGMTSGSPSTAAAGSTEATPAKPVHKPVIKPATEPANTPPSTSANPPAEKPAKTKEATVPEPATTHPAPDGNAAEPPR
jgi:rod shape-determining protein MreC